MGIQDKTKDQLIEELRLHQIELEMQNEELKRAHAELEKSRDRFSDLYDFAPVGYLTVSDTGMIVEANLRAAHLLDVERSQLINSPFSRFVLIEDQDIVYFHRRNCLAQQVRQTCEIRMVKGDGTEFSAQLESVAVGQHNEQPVQLRISIIDITERKRAGEALLQSEKKYRLIFNTAPVGIMQFDSHGIITDCNEKFAEVLGASQEQVIGFNLLTSLKNEDVKEAIRKALSGKVGTYEGEYTSVTGDKTRFGRITYAPFYVPGTSSPGGIAIADDFTERKLAEEALRVSEERLRLMVEKAPLAMLVAPATGHEIEYLNPKFIELFGYTIEDVLDVNEWRRLAYPDEQYRSWVLSEANRRGAIAVTNRTATEPLEVEVICKDGSKKIVEWVLVSVGQKIVVFGLDLTERKNAELERESLRSQLLQSQKMEAVGTLAAGIAHDFNNMLQVILGYSEILLNEKSKVEPGYAELDKIVRTSIEARDLVQKIRLFSRKADIQPVPLDLNHQISELAKLLSHTLLKTINLDLLLGENLDLINADPALVDQMVTNLAINASEAMTDGGTLTIESQNILLDDDFCKTHAGAKPGPHVLLTISDTGKGMTKDLLDRMFEPFFSTKQRDYHRGTGLGLSIVKGIVDEHSGYITIESEVGRGTTFRIYFPILAAQPKPHLQVEAKIELASEASETILLVEDEDLVRDSGIRLLERFGYKVIAVSDGQKALEVFAKERDNIVLVILDIVMPRMDGKECLRELLKINPAVKVLISSGVAQDDRVKEVVDLGARGVLLKPYSMKVLKEKVRDILDSQ